MKHIRTAICSLSVLLFSALSAHVSAQKLYNFGIQAGGGLNFASFQASANANSYQVDAYKLSPNLGVFMDVNPPLINNLVLHAALGWRQRAYGNEAAAGTISGNTSALNYSVENSYLHADGAVRILLGNKVIKPYIGAGLRFDARLKTTVTLDNPAAVAADPDKAKQNLSTRFDADTKNFTVSGLVTAGVKISRLTVELEWNPDLTEAYRSSNPFNTANNTVTGKNSMISLNVGFKLFGL